MGEKLRPFSGAETVKKLEKAGWKSVRQKGSHVMMTRPDYFYTLSIPQHKELGSGILKKILRQANLSPEKFLDL